MGWKKRELITGALDEIGIQGYQFDVSPEEDAKALRRLDSLMAAWERLGVRLGYNFPASAEASDLDDDSGIPDSANRPVLLQLSIELAPGYGKAVSPDTKRGARESFAPLQAGAAFPTQQQYPDTLPRGAGNKPWRTVNNPFFPQPCDDPLRVTQGGDLRVLPE